MLCSIFISLLLQMEFMLETICDIKNNKKKPKEDTVQHTRIKKWLQKVLLFNFCSLCFLFTLFFCFELNLLQASLFN